MNFEDQIRSHSQRVKTMKAHIMTEEATKTSLVMPFFQTLGYDVFNPNEFTPEYVADVGIKKGEKVDYAILDKSGNPLILIEAKGVHEQLLKHDSQLFRYFGTTTAKFGILTNGIIYKFFTDLEETNKMDSVPFLEINLESIKDPLIQELKKFTKDQFDLELIKDTASELKFLGLIRNVLKDDFTNPSDEFVRYILDKEVYEGRNTQAVVDKFKPLVKKSIVQYINDLVNDKIQSALDRKEPDVSTMTKDVDNDDSIENPTPDKEEIIRGIHTTDDEIESWYIIKSIVRGKVDTSRITYKDTLTYFGVLLDSKVTKWICRIYLRDKSNILEIQLKNEKYRLSITNLDDIYLHSDKLLARLEELL